MTERLACDVTRCPRPADVLVTFYGGIKEWPFCTRHALHHDGSFRWKGKVGSVRTIADTEASWFESTTP